MFDGGEHHIRQHQRTLGFRSWLLAECSEGSESMCIGFDNRLSRSSTLVNLQDV